MTTIQFKDLPPNYTHAPLRYEGCENALEPTIGDAVRVYAFQGFEPETMNVCVTRRAFIYSEDSLTIEIFCKTVNPTP